MLGAGVALLRDQRMLANPRVALAQIDARFLRQAHQPLAGCVHQLGVGREGDRLLLHRGIDNDAGEVGGFGRSDLDGDGHAFLPEGGQPLLAHALAPAGERGVYAFS